MKTSTVIAGAILVGAAAYTGVAWYVGVRSEETIRTGVDQANARIIKTLGPDLGTSGARIDIGEYDRGLFSSEVRYTITIQGEDERLQVELADHMQHGPFPWGLLKQGSFVPALAYSRSRLVDNEAVKRWFDAARGAMPLEVETRIGMGGDGVSTWNLAPLEWAVDNDRLAFSGGQMQVRFSNQFRDSVGEGRFASLVMGGAEDDRLALDDIRLQSRTSTADDDTVEVHSRLEAASLMIGEDAADSVKFEGLSATLDSRQQGALLDASLRYDFSRINVGGIDLGSITVGGEVSRFNFEAFSALLAEYDAIAQAHGAEDDEDFELTPQDEERLFAKLLPVLASSPEVAVQPVVWRNEKGESTFALQAFFQPAGAEPQAQDDLFQSLKTLRFELVLSRPMVLQAFAQTGSGEREQQQLEMLAAIMYDRYVSELEREGLVSREGDRAQASIVYTDGGVNVNGVEMSLEAFLDRFGGFFFM